MQTLQPVQDADSREIAHDAVTEQDENLANTQVVALDVAADEDAAADENISNDVEVKTDHLATNAEPTNRAAVENGVALLNGSSQSPTAVAEQETTVSETAPSEPDDELTPTVLPEKPLPPKAVQRGLRAGMRFGIR